MNTFTVNIPLKPKAKARPRVGKWGAYTDKATREFEEAIKKAYKKAKGPKFTGPVQLTVSFYSESISITIKSIDAESSLRGDIDNYLKSIMDGLNDIAYEDDKQVLNIKAYKR